MKRIISLFLLICMTLIAFIMPSSIVFADATDDAILAKIDELNNILGGTCFNADHGTGCGAKSNGHGCNNCLTSNIVNKSWFINLFGQCSTANFANHYTPTGQMTRNAYSCAGFAAFAEWYIFRSSNSDTISTEKIGTYNFNYGNASSYARVGDVLRLDNGHSAIFISANSSGIMVLDSNGSGSYNCVVAKHQIPYSWHNTITISRATNRTVTPSQPTNSLETPIISVEKTTWTDAEPVKMSWQVCKNADYYSIMAYDENMTSVIPLGITNEISFQTKLPKGKYYIQVESIREIENSEELITQNSELQLITVISPHSEAKLNNGVFEISAYDIDNGYTIILALYKDSKFAELQSITYNGETTPITFIPTQAYDSAKVMVWDGLKTLRPICDFEQVDLSR